MRMQICHTVNLQIGSPIRFHWHIDPPGTFDEDQFLKLCRGAEEAGIDSVGVPGTLPETLQLATAAAPQFHRVRFRIFCGVDPDSLYSPAWEKLASRLILHLTPRQAEMEKAARFIREYRALAASFEPGEIDIEGNTAEAAFLAIKHGDVLWLRPDAPRQVYADALPVMHFGKQVGITGTGEQLAVSMHELRKEGISQFLFEAPADGRFFELVRSLGREVVGV